LKRYQLVSEKGFNNVNIETIARLMNKNKSSFYHYFGDWEGFENALLEYHLVLAKQFAIEANSLQGIMPDLVNLFIEHKTDIFFHKQLRINRAKPHFKKCFETVYKMFENAILDKWIAFLKMEEHSFLAEKFLLLLSDNFLLQITPQNYNHTWINNYIQEVAKLLIDINSRSKI
jgi:AcrR family transcriptional regulator